MISSLVRPSAPLTWARLRLRVAGDSAADVLARSRVLAELLPLIPVDGTPLHRSLAVQGALLAVAADGHGVVAQVVADPERFPAVAGALGVALRTPAPDALVRHAREQAALAWRWERDDSEALADLVADLLLHTSPSAWPDVHAELVTAMEVNEPGEWSGSESVAHVGPRDETAALAALRGPVGRSTTDSSDAAQAPARWRLEVVSDGSALVRLGWRSPGRDDPDFAPLAVAARVVGGHHRSRLTREFRTERGWSYSPWALLRAGRGHGLWQVSVRVPTEHVAETVDRVCELVRGYEQDDVEHATAIAHSVTEIRRLWSSGDSAVSLLGYWQDLGLEVLPEKQRWLSALGSTTPADVAAAARRWLAGEPHLEVVLA